MIKNRIYFLVLALLAITGAAAQNVTSPPADIIVSANRKQQVRFGIDAERLWHWNSQLKNELARLS